ncbi:LysR family transcriptional regulator ArgP [Leisingera caerulea]|uniref:LysR family transcriptional regulator ArgP n=1 Tax=Leisingera caerulea TaxID=506591 RepID=UPI0004031F7A|nr:LysR family transcriptional regulator ArgP [Leisingera caerulea]UWQ50974.1 LysR family transcriptional regulator ArgP [Leisingera caerulea]UWQ63790.1 LysR family transcriptional regulator ArgP [Leisingera caerulea]UWQ84704.1 LysR family transcriptional regulator ArgP [Leisingera caerulea]
MNMDPSQLAALSAVLRLGSFEAAAHALAVTPSAISQRIKALEDRTGTALVLRGAPCTGTAAGLRIAKHAEDIGLLEAQLARELALEAGHGPVRLRIAVNADSLASWFIGAMAAVEGVLFDLLVDDQDHSAEWLKRGEVSAAVTASSKPVTGFEAYPLGTLDYAATASPAFMARWFADGVTPEAAAKAPCMIFNAKDNLQRLWLERNVAPGLAPPAHFLPSTQAFIDAAAAGLGWGMNPLAMVAQDIRTGRLVPLIPDSTLPVPLTWQVARVMAPALAEVTRAVQKSARQYLTQD